MTSGRHQPEAVSGERTTSTLDRVRSLQSRMTGVMAFGLMAAVGATILGWYYAHAARSAVVSRPDLSTSAPRAAQGDLALPSIGPVVAPTVLPGVQAPAEQPARTASTPDFADTASVESGGPAVGPLGANVETTPVRDVDRPMGSPHTTMDRKLSGVAFSTQSSTVRPSASSAAVDSEPAAAMHAHLLPGSHLLLPKGAFIDCTLETAIDSTLPGMTTCVTATDTFGVDGEVVLLERGTKLVGEVKGQVPLGAARVFVLWTEARTPAGVVVPLDSPGADELGRAGLPGEVSRHFWERFGAAMLVSIIDGAVEAGGQSQNRGAGTVVVNPAGGQGVVTEVLKGTVNIPPTIVKRQGDRIQILVAHDLDFRSVYSLGMKAHGP